MADKTLPKKEKKKEETKGEEKKDEKKENGVTEKVIMRLMRSDIDRKR